MKYEQCPLITIITVCYNAAKELEHTIMSVSSQTYQKIEFIVVDGNSKDDTLLVIKQNEQFITKWLSECDKGVYDAMNKGIRLSSGDWIIFMNAGDSFHHNTVLEEVFGKEYSDNIGVIYGDANFLFPKYGSVLKKMNNLLGKEQALSICHQSSFTRSKYLKENQFDLSYKIAADANTFYKLWERNIGFIYIPICIANYEAVSGISSTKFYMLHSERSRILGLTWYNSLNWWKGMFKSVIKIIIRRIQTDANYEKHYYERIAKKNNTNAG